MIGSNLGGYEIIEEIGRGGMGCVYKARQPSLDRTVAVKVLLPQLAADEVFVERFLREARSIATLEHPGIVTIYDVGEADGTYYFAMQLLDGQPLDELLDDGKALEVDAAADIVGQVAKALEFAHEAGILHRDVKPGNIIVTSSGRAVLTDFGIAQLLTDTRLTKTGTSIGSPEYMSPEQIEGKKLDARADLYSLGVVFYQMLTGRVPYEGESPVAVVYQHVKSPVPSPRDTDPDIPERFDVVTTRLMAKLPEERFASAEELLSGLDGRVLDRGAKVERRGAAPGMPKWVWGAVGAVVLLIVAIVGFSGSDEDVPSESSVASETVVSEAPDDPPPTPVAATEESEPPEAESPPLEAAPQPVPPPAPTPKPQTFQVTSSPAGAAVTLDGLALSTTPVSVDLLPETRYELGLRLDGHDPVGMSFRLDDLTESQRISKGLHFPLRSSIPPGVLVIQADYPVSVRLGGRSYAGKRIEVPPGTYNAQITAPSVFLSLGRQVRIQSGATETIALPIATTVKLGANPSRCRVKIDGMDAGYVPAEIQIAVGNHRFEFDWESLGKSLVLTRKITVRTDRVFATAPR